MTDEIDHAYQNSLTREMHAGLSDDEKKAAEFGFRDGWVAGRRALLLKRSEAAELETPGAAVQPMAHAGRT